MVRGEDSVGVLDRCVELTEQAGKTLEPAPSQVLVKALWIEITWTQQGSVKEDM